VQRYRVIVRQGYRNVPSDKFPVPADIGFASRIWQQYCHVRDAVFTLEPQSLACGGNTIGTIARRADRMVDIAQAYNEAKIIAVVHSYPERAFTIGPYKARRLRAQSIRAEILDRHRIREGVAGYHSAPELINNF